MAFGAGSYPEAPEPTRKQLRWEQELEVAEEQYKHLKSKLEAGEVDLMGLYDFHEKYSLDDTIVAQYDLDDAEPTIGWCDELMADLDSCMRVLKDRLREGRWE